MTTWTPAPAAPTVPASWMPVAELPIRFHLLPPGLPEDAAPEDIFAEAGGFRFRFGNALYRYSRFGLEKDDA